MDRNLFEQLYSQYYQPLFLYAYSLTHNKADAEDLTANTFVKALITFEQGNIRAWLYTVLHNEFLDLKKQQKKEISVDEELLQNTPGNTDIWEQYLQNEQYHWLYREIGKLPFLQREIMLLSIQTDYKDQEIGHILGITPAHVRVLRHRAKNQLLNASKEESI